MTILVNRRILDIINTTRATQESNWDKLTRLESLYSKYNFMVFDLPRFELDDKEKFMNIWNREHIESSRTTPGRINPYAASPKMFRSLDIINTDVPEERASKAWTNKYMDLRLEFPKFYQQLYDQLPFYNINYLKIWQSIIPIEFHRDDSARYFNIPTELRIMIHDENPSGTLVIAPELCIADTKFIKLPPDTNCFAWNNVRCLHGSVKNEGKEKLLGILYGKLNLDALEIMYEKSIAKYQKYNSWSDNDPYTSLLTR